MPVKLLTLDEAAALLRMEAKEIKALVTSGELPCIWQGARMMFEYDELDTWYSNRLVRHLPIRHAEHAQPVPQEMRLADYCRLETMEPALAGKTKPAILRSLTQLAERTGMLYNPEEFLENIRRREELSSTAMAEGIALVHPMDRDEFLCEGPFLAVGHSTVPVFFGEADGVPTDLFFLICSTDPEEHLQILAKLCQAIADGKVLEALRAAETPEEMLAAFQGL